MLRPKTVITSYIHQTAYCPACRRQVFEKLQGELVFALIGPAAKAAALYLRHEIKLPYKPRLLSWSVCSQALRRMERSESTAI